MIAACAPLLACSDDAATPMDVGSADTHMTSDAKIIQELGATADVMSHDASPEDSDVTPGDGPAVKEGGAGPCAAWSQWNCSEPGGNSCRASCTVSGTQLELECSTKGGQLDCECKKSGVKTSCAYSGPAPATCDACRAAFLAGCCNPP